MIHDQDCVLQLKQNKYELINTMIAVIEALDHYTRDHSKNVANYALLLAEELGCPAHEIETIYYGALFHDIGKIGIPINVLQKPRSLTDAEYDVIKEHPTKGASILSHAQACRDLIPIVLHHHEKFSGNGYPLGLAGSMIPFGARLVAVVDAFDALTTNRVYRKAQGGKRAIDEIIKHTPEQFDPEIVQAFVKIEKNV